VEPCLFLLVCEVFRIISKLIFTNFTPLFGKALQFLYLCLHKVKMWNIYHADCESGIDLSPSRLWIVKNKRVQRTQRILHKPRLDHHPQQWRTQKIFMGCSFVFGLRCLRRHNLTSYSCFQTNVLAKFVYIICIYSSTRAAFILCVTAVNINYQRFKLNIRRKYTQRYDTAVRNCKNFRLLIITAD